MYELFPIHPNQVVTTTQNHMDLGYLIEYLFNWNE